ncbi:phosphate/phosphite/phosphonate ABC transporter substrate-binding protein [Aridibaculum aurantiacum]|uniref:phosphate/phosphite/phosphonate ABC transporter substrate-binding protein n=1 Tax=Aridibaculum aurantiacum TaxID=2810307 RepID=UPI001A977A5E|nr:phosphate/phosphite/phosphonate ABC transporter substrate-binding protein [Aridibaculum aurantiacum]
MRFIFLILFTALVVQGTAQTVRLATYRYGNNSRLQSLQPYADHLRNKYKFDVSIKSYESVHALIQAMQKNEVDIALINTFGYLLLESEGKHNMRAVATLKVTRQISDGYRTAIIAGPQVTVHKLEELKKLGSKLRLTLVNRGSTSGYLVPRMALAGAGIPSPESTFKYVLYSEIHDAAVDAVLSRMADVAAVGYSEYSRYVQQDASNRSKMRLLWLSPEIPYGPIMFNNKMSAGLNAQLLHSFLNLHKENAAAFEAMKSGWSETKDASFFFTIDGSYYSNFKKLLGSEHDIQKMLKQVKR